MITLLPDWAQPDIQPVRLCTVSPCQVYDCVFNSLDSLAEELLLVRLCIQRASARSVTVSVTVWQMNYYFQDFVQRASARSVTVSITVWTVWQRNYYYLSDFVQ